jgi:hypothetical protein
LSEIMEPSIVDRLWHKMRGDLATFDLEVAAGNQLMCCVCGRLLTKEWFDLEHLIPQQALKADPASVRSNPETPANVRAGNLLLCKKPLNYKGAKAYNNGCNSWKGRYYDRPISQIFSGETSEAGSGRLTTSRHIIGGLVLGYLAMVAEFGYVVVLMRSGLLMREQFFNPNKYHHALGLRHQMLLGGAPFTEPDERVWTNPFSFSFKNEGCIVAARNFAVIVPVSRDPRIPIARHLRFVPPKYTMRPDFRAVFD